MTTVPLSEAKSRLSEIADDVSRTHDRVNVTRNGREYVVIMAAEDLDSLEATVELLSDQDAVRRIAAAIAEVDRGEIVTKEELLAAMEARRRGSE